MKTIHPCTIHRVGARGVRHRRLREQDGASTEGDRRHRSGSRRREQGRDQVRHPAEVQAVNDQVANLKAMFDKKDYKGVLAAAPAVLTQAQGLTSAAAAKKTEMMDAYAGGGAPRQQRSGSRGGDPEPGRRTLEVEEAPAGMDALRSTASRPVSRRRTPCGARPRRRRPPATWNRP